MTPLAGYMKVMRGLCATAPDRRSGKNSPIPMNDIAMSGFFRNARPSCMPGGRCSPARDAPVPMPCSASMTSRATIMSAGCRPACRPDMQVRGSTTCRRRRSEEERWRSCAGRAGICRWRQVAPDTSRGPGSTVRTGGRGRGRRDHPPLPRHGLHVIVAPGRAGLCHSARARLPPGRGRQAGSRAGGREAGADIHCRRPVREAIGNAGGSFLLTCKPTSRVTLHEHVHGARLDEAGRAARPCAGAGSTPGG